MRSMLVSHWGSKLGLEVLEGLSRLYLTLVWESSVLIALCSDNVLPADCQFGAVDMMRIMSRCEAKSARSEAKDPLATSSGRSVDGDLDSLLARTACELGSDGVSAAMESLSTSETVAASSPMDMDLAGSSTAADKHCHLIPVIVDIMGPSVCEALIHVAVCLSIQPHHPRMIRPGNCLYLM